MHQNPLHDEFFHGNFLVHHSFSSVHWLLRVSKEKHDSILNELDHTEKAKVPGTDLTVAKFNDKIMTTDLRIEVKVKSEEE